ncbi:MAG: hypothetical protein NTV42_08355 [Chloroflexi bacterium]|nr:hypothetical protein [Chloroflexota bacterium]
MMPENEGPELYKQFEVLVCTGALSFRGTLRCDFSQRLIDALNEGVRTDTWVKVVKFLPILDVTMTGTGVGEKKFPSIYIAKSNIVFVAQISGDNTEKPLRAYPFREKLPVVVMAYAARVSDVQYALDGRIYVETWGKVIDTVESEARFVPLTQVEINPPLPGAGSRFDFVALNKDHIISICESPGR